MPPRKRKTSVSKVNQRKDESLVSLLNNFLNPNLSQVEITQNAFAIQLKLTKFLSSKHLQKNRNTKKKLDSTESDADQKESLQTQKRKKAEGFDQNEFAEKAIFIVDHYLNNSNGKDETEEISQNRLTIMNFIPSLLQKIDSIDQVYIQKLIEQINPDQSSFEIQLPLLHSISEILHGPQLSNVFQEKIKSYIKPNLSISSSLLNICIFNFETQKNYQAQWAEIIRKVFISSNRRQLLDSSLLLKSKRTCSNELCNSLCRILQNQDEKANELDFFLILLLSSINSITTNKLLKFFTNSNRLDELTIKNCPIQVVPMNNIIDAIYTISSTRNPNSKIKTELPRIISELFICSENSEILTFALFNEDENKIFLEATIEAISIASQEAPQLFISTFDSIGVLYTVSKQVSHRLIDPILKLATIFTQLFDSVVIYLKKLVNHPSGTLTAIHSLCFLLQDLGTKHKNQRQLYETDKNSPIKRRSNSRKKNQSKQKEIDFENKSNCIEMQLEILKVIDWIASISAYLRSLVLKNLSNYVTYLSERSRTEAKKIANKYKETMLNPELFVDLITDSFSDQNDESYKNLVFAKEYPSSELQLLISLGEPPSDYFYFLECQNDNFNLDFHFPLQLSLRADVYSILAPFNNDAFVTFSEYLKVIDFIASEEERRIISEWCSLKLDDSFVRNVIVEEQTDDPLLLYTILRQLSTFSSSSLSTDKELVTSCIKLFAQTAESDFGATKIALKKHHLICSVLPNDAFEDEIYQFREELTFQIAEFAKIDQNRESFLDFDPSFFIEEMKKVIVESAMTGRYCQAFFDLFEKLLPVDSDSTKKLFDLLATLKFDDVKIFSAIVDLLLSKSPPEDAFTVSDLLLSCVKGEDDTVFVKKDTLKNAVLIRISKFISTFNSHEKEKEINQELFNQMMKLTTDLMSFENLVHSVCFALFRTISVVIKKFTENMKMKNEKNEDSDLFGFFSFDEFMKFKKICDDWIFVNKQKVGIKRCGICKAYLQMAENIFRKKNGLEEEEEDEDESNDNDIHDYGAEFDSLLEMLKNEENNNNKEKNDDDGENDFINIEDIFKNDNSDSKKKKKKKKKKTKKLPHFVTRKWRSNSKWIDEGLKEVTDSDDNFADLEDFVVASSPSQSASDEEEDNN